MIKARYEREGQKPLILLGLSDENLRRLREGMPILVHGDDLDIDVDISIVSGRDEESIARELIGAGFEPPSSPGSGKSAT